MVSVLDQKNNNDPSEVPGYATLGEAGGEDGSG